MSATAGAARIDKMHEIIDHLEEAVRLARVIAAKDIVEYVEPAIATAKDALSVALVEHSRREWISRPRQADNPSC